MVLFSERYGYTKPRDVLIRECFPMEIESAICNCCEKFVSPIDYSKLQLEVWTTFLNKKSRDFNRGFYGSGYQLVIESFLSDKEIVWYNKLNLLEFIVKYLHQFHRNIFLYFSQNLNSEFKRLNYSYRIIDQKIIEITSDEEVISIEASLRSIMVPEIWTVV